jgi:hypothetical protein
VPKLHREVERRDPGRQSLAGFGQQAWKAQAPKPEFNPEDSRGLDIESLRGFELGRAGITTYQKEIHLKTAGHRDMHDLTTEVAHIVGQFCIRTGIVQLFNMGSTAAPT